MADRPVRCSGKDSRGNITSIGNAGEYWSPRPAVNAIADIESGLHNYYVPWTTGRTEIHVAVGPGGKYLRTDRDNTTRNNLDELPDC